MSLTTHEHPAPAAEALIIIDVQVGLVSGEGAVPQAIPVLDRIKRLLDKARANEALIIQLQNDGPVGAVDEPGTPGWQLALPIEQRGNELVIRKSEDDGFHRTGLSNVLAEHDVRCIAVCGLLSEMCVSATIRTAMAMGFTVVMPHDTHATYDIPALPGISDQVPAETVSRVAEWALGDQLNLVAHATDVSFATLIHKI
jgi:nicotinamidase-related amidase